MEVSIFGQLKHRRCLFVDDENSAARIENQDAFDHAAQDGVGLLGFRADALYIVADLFAHLVEMLFEQMNLIFMFAGEKSLWKRTAGELSGKFHKPFHSRGNVT